jgi:hypothetical protein
MTVIVKRSLKSYDEKFKELLGSIDNLEAEIGWDKSAVYKDSGIPVATIAAIHEYGSPTKNIPPRLGMRATIKQKSNEWKNIFYKLVKQAIEKGESIKSAFIKTVLKAEGDFAETITKVTTPPLKYSTIKARLNRKKNQTVLGKLDKPLVDTGYMLTTLSSKAK